MIILITFIGCVLSLLLAKTITLRAIITFYLSTLFFGNALVHVSGVGNWTRLDEYAYRTNEIQLLLLILTVAILVMAIMESLLYKNKLSFVQLIEYIKSSFRVTSGQRKILYAGLIISVVFILYAFGFTGLFLRNEYIPEGNKILKSIGVLLLLFTIVPIVIFERKSFKLFIVVTLCFFLFLGISSRFIALFPVLMTIRLLRKNVMRNTKVVFFGLLTTLLCLVLVIEGRRAENHGLIPYIENILTEGVDLELSFFVLKYTFSYSLDAIEYVITGFNDYQDTYFWSSINPLPSFLLGFNDWSILRINSSQPFPSIAELWLHSPFTLFIYVFVSSAIFSVSDRFYTTSSLYPMTLVNLALGLLFTFYMLQYNLRQSNRILTIALALLIFFRLSIFFKKKL